MSIRTKHTGMDRWQDTTNAKLYMIEEPTEEQILQCLKECSDDLESEIRARYQDEQGKISPSQLRRFERDMVPVRYARALLRGKGDVSL